MIARALEIKGIKTTLTSWNAKPIELTRPPRATITKLKRGMTLGHPNNSAQQLRNLKSTLNLLSKDTLFKPVYLDEK
ncbi:MAG: hypothetical protein KAT05_12035 [Spirochaetes bacterium]|nr:hypothetical protein [Spirochaetota bacterium]MCK5032298.1 hypothetical protein [Calditrichia bacterium]